MGKPTNHCGACSTRLLAALSILVILSSLITGTRSASCCVRYRRQPLHCKRLSAYTLQTINKSCHITAIIFHTRTGFECADPSKDWVIRRMRCVDEKRSKEKIYSVLQ